MEVISMSLSSITTSLGCIVILAWVWNAVDWVWFRPKRIERLLRKQGFKGNSYRLFFGDKKQSVEMVRETTSKPMQACSNDFMTRIFPFLLQTISTHGERSFIWEGPTAAVIITKPEMIREVLMKVKEFPKLDSHPLIKKLSNGLVRLEGLKWAQDRKLISPAFHMDKLKHMLPAFESCAEDMVDKWEKMVSKTGSEEVEMWSFLHDMSADAISRAAFGSSFEEGRRVFELIREQVILLLRAMQSVYIPGSRFLPTQTNRRIDEIKNEIEAFLKNMIHKRKKAIEAGEATKDDLLGLVLNSSLQHGSAKKQQENIKLSLQEVIEECKLFYLAGQDTTSSLLVWTLVLLSKHQDWQHQAREEILNTFGNNKPNFQGLSQLKKVNMILHEVLRLYPPVNQLNRKVLRDTTLGDMQLPAGVVINLPTLYVQHSEKIWGPDAEEFKPERFSDGVLKATGGNMSFFAFGWGPRVCIGSNFAMVEAKATLAIILQRFSLELSPSYVHAPATSNGTLRPQFGAKLILHRL